MCKYILIHHDIHREKLVYLFILFLLLGLCSTIIGVKDKTNEKQNLQKTI
jgi:hypothetical protein